MFSRRPVRVPRTARIAMDLGLAVTASYDQSAKIWDVASGQLVHPYWRHKGALLSAVFSPDSRWVASAGEDSTVKVWDSHSGALVHSFRGHTGLVGSLAFSPKGRWLFSGSRDKTVRIWDLTQLNGDVGDR